MTPGRCQFFTDSGTNATPSLPPRAQAPFASPRLLARSTARSQLLVTRVHFAPVAISSFTSTNTFVKLGLVLEFSPFLASILNHSFTNRRALPREDGCQEIDYPMPPTDEPSASPDSKPSMHVCPDASRWFTEEVQPHEPALRAILSRLVASLSDVDDLVQECYIRMLRARERVPIRSSKAFLFTTARNAAHDLRRRRAVADPIAITENPDSPILYDERAEVVDFVCRQQELALLAEAIRELPERCRQVFLLRKIQEFPQKEIARRLGITESTVETLVAKGALRCAQYLRKRGLGSR